MKEVPMKSITFAPPEVFVPTPVHLEILNAVAESQSCQIRQVVQKLYPGTSESTVRSGVTVLLSKGCLDGGKSGTGIILRLTSKGRVLMQKAAAK